MLVERKPNAKRNMKLFLHCRQPLWQLERAQREKLIVWKCPSINSNHFFPVLGRERGNKGTSKSELEVLCTQASFCVFSKSVRCRPQGSLLIEPFNLSLQRFWGGPCEEKGYLVLWPSLTYGFKRPIPSQTCTQLCFIKAITVCSSNAQCDSTESLSSVPRPSLFGFTVIWDTLFRSMQKQTIP